MIRWIVAGLAVVALSATTATADSWRDAQRADRHVQSEWRDYQRALRTGDYKHIQNEWREYQRAAYRRDMRYGRPVPVWSAPAPVWYYSGPSYTSPYPVGGGVMIWQ